MSVHRSVRLVVIGLRRHEPSRRSPSGVSPLGRYIDLRRRGVLARRALFNWSVGHARPADEPCCHAGARRSIVPVRPSRVRGATARCRVARLGRYTSFAQFVLVGARATSTVASRSLAGGRRINNRATVVLPMLDRARAARNFSILLAKSAVNQSHIGLPLTSSLADVTCDS